MHQFSPLPFLSRLIGHEGAPGSRDDDRPHWKTARPKSFRTASGSKHRDSNGGHTEEQHRQTFRDTYMLQSRIGTGSNSQVFAAVERSTGLQVAVKAVHTDWLDRRRAAFLRREVEIHREVSSHPFVVPLRGVFNDPEACYIVEELAEGGSLLEYLHSRASMETEKEVRLLLRRLLMALRFLHDRGIVHRDIKPENLLVMRKGVLMSAKLADFGFATRLDKSGTNTAAGGPAYGTPEYVAPEVLLQQPFCGKADIWSTGVTAFCLLTGMLPFRGHTLDTLYTAVLDGACSFAGAEWMNVSPHAAHFVSRMLVVNPDDRLSATELLEHPWMAGGGGGIRDATFVTGATCVRVRSLKAVGWAIVFLNRLLARTGRHTIAERIVRQQMLELGSP